MDSLITAAARATLEAHGDRANAAHARHLEVRRLLLLGHLAEGLKSLATMEKPTPEGGGAGSSSPRGRSFSW
jgi:hypothetical protein